MSIGRERTEFEPLPIQRELAALPVTALTTSAQTILTVPAGRFFQIGCMHLINTTGSAVTVDVHRVPSGGSLAAGNEIIPSESIFAKSVSSTERFCRMLGPGETLQALASASGVNMELWGVFIDGGDPL